MISEEYRELNKQLHADTKKIYGDDGGRWADYVISACRGGEFTSVLDYGCGKGALRKAIYAKTPEFDVFEYDPAIEGKDESPSPVDLVFCGDVLEHIEPDYLDDVLSDINRCAEKGAILYIATNEAIKTLPDGRNAHLIQENLHWWFNKLSDYFEITSAYVYKQMRIMFHCVPKGSNMT